MSSGTEHKRPRQLYEPESLQNNFKNYVPYTINSMYPETNNLF